MASTLAASLELVKEGALEARQTQAFADVYLRKRAGQLFSKSRFIAAQFEAYLEGDLWLDLARHANDMADTLRAGLARSKRGREAWPTCGNEVFAILEREAVGSLRAAGAAFYDWSAPAGILVPVAGDEVLVRMVTSFATSAEDVEVFLQRLDA